MIAMTQSLATVSLLVTDYDDAIAFYCDTLGFNLVADTDMGGGKRWVVVAPAGQSGAQLLLAKADGPAQIAAIGNQGGGRVMFFLNTSHFIRDHAAMLENGIKFLEAPRQEPYGTVAVFEDLYGNKWDFIEPKKA
ncbi:Catechol 2,3-dioxygenase [Devosia psychrophila]|jgi:catechol 2,3-dioxygenase-like lactoylglutathione lyase family enzyme|uniref:Catechol 2,3-dioxygenase n=2 Tax=Devosia psychrophila TaxID=728005 RepID=A0A1I1M3X7_9HYPH|nr:Catechol 2,3-dioxygenase [Devosia psychrophila]